MSSTKEVSRALNTGKEIELKGGQIVIVKEPTLEHTLRILTDLMSVAGKLDTSGMLDETSFISNLLMDSEVRAEIENIASACTGLPTKELKELGVSDWLRIIAAIKEVIVWEEIKELFFQVVPKEALQKVIPVTTQQEQPSPQSEE